MFLVVVIVDGGAQVVDVFPPGLGCHVTVLEALNDELDHQVPGSEQLALELVLQEFRTRRMRNDYQRCANPQSSGGLLHARTHTHTHTRTHTHTHARTHTHTHTQTHAHTNTHAHARTHAHAHTHAHTHTHTHARTACVDKQTKKDKLYRKGRGEYECSNIKVV